CVAKFQAQRQAQAEAVAAPEEKRTKVSRLRDRALAEPIPEPGEDADEDDEDLPQLYSHGDAEDPNERDEWLIKELMPVPCRGILVGRTHSGKSLFLVDMVVRIAAGVPFLEHKIARQSGAIIFSAE